MYRIKEEDIKKGQNLHYEFLKGMTGSFYTALFTAISKADFVNIRKMAKGFPAEVYAYLEFTGQLERLNWEIE